MATAAVKVKQTQSESEAPPAASAAEAPVFKPQNVQIDVAGQISRSIVARAPKGLVSDDLRDPAVWRLVQASSFSALIKMDRILIIAYDESWIVEGIVKFASNSEARLAILRVSGFGGIGEGLFSDGVLQVYWDGASYGIRRVSDQVPVGRGYASEGVAIEALCKYYPTKVPA